MSMDAAAALSFTTSREFIMFLFIRCELMVTRGMKNKNQIVILGWLCDVVIMITVHITYI
jgi:hypothetical protein